MERGREGSAKEGLAGSPWGIPPILEMSGTFELEDGGMVAAAAGLAGKEEGRLGRELVTLLLDIWRNVCPQVDGGCRRGTVWRKEGEIARRSDMDRPSTFASKRSLFFNDFVDRHIQNSVENGRGGVFVYRQ